MYPGEIRPTVSLLLVFLLEIITLNDRPPFEVDPGDLELDNEPEVRLSPASVAHHRSQAEKRGRYFLKGPLGFDWICANVPDPASRVILIAYALMDMEKANELALGAKVWGCAGIVDRYQRRRVLERLRSVDGSFEIEDRRGRTSVIRKLETKKSETLHQRPQPIIS